MYSLLLALMDRYIIDIGWNMSIQNLSPTINFLIKNGDNDVGFVTMISTEASVPVNTKGVLRSMKTRQSIEIDVSCIYI